MAASNWDAERLDMSPERNIPLEYRVDNMALQLMLGVPPDVITISGANLDRPTPRTTRDFVLPEQSRDNQLKKHERSQDPKSTDIKRTIDGIPIRTIYVTNVGQLVTRNDLYRIFGLYGQIKNVYLSSALNMRSKTFAFVTYFDPKSATRALCFKSVQDLRGCYMFLLPADSWHQPKELPNGQIQWCNKSVTGINKEEDDDVNDETIPIEERFVTTEINAESLNILNDDCLLHVFSFLSLVEVARIEIVCKRWQGLSYHMWTHLHKLNFFEPTIPKLQATTPVLEGCLRRCGQSLQELNLTPSTTNGFDKTTLAVVAKYCTNLQRLQVSQLFIGRRSLALLGRSCPNLKVLIMNECLKLTDGELISLLLKCRLLTSLDISNCKGVSGKFLSMIQSPLVDLHLVGISVVDADSLIKCLRAVSGSLERLSVQSCGNLYGDKFDKMMSAVPNLVSFCMGPYVAWGNNYEHGLSAIGKLENLSSINLQFNKAVNDETLASIVKGCKNLTEVNLTHSGGMVIGNGELLSSTGLELLSKLPKLKSLDVSYLEILTDSVLKTLSSRNSKLQKLICRACPGISDEGCVQVVMVCNDLELFDLSGCPVSEETVSAALTSVKMRTNNIPLRLIVGGSDVREATNDPEVPLLTIDFEDYSEDHLRPDFVDELFFPYSDSDDDDFDDDEFDLDDIKNYIDCDCHFDFDDDDDDVDDDSPYNMRFFGALHSIRNEDTDED